MFVFHLTKGDNVLCTIHSTEPRHVTSRLIRVSELNIRKCLTYPPAVKRVYLFTFLAQNNTT
jgi:hypothetical protein